MAKTQKQGVGVSFPSSPLLEKEKGNHFTVDLYIRVSTFSQLEGDSLEEQENELRKFCDYRGFRIHRIYCEEAKSGGNTRRPEYQKLISDIEHHRIDAVVVKKLDRLSRSLLDFEQLMVLMQRNDIEFMSLRENFDTTTAMGKAMLRMALVFAQLEREQTSERVSDVMHYRASLGHHNGGKTPFGYVSANKELLVSQKDKRVVELIFTLFLKTQSVTAVANHLNDAKIPSPTTPMWTESYVEFLLKSPIYKGCVTWKNNIYTGLHSPIVAPSSWDAVQSIFQAKKSSKALSKSKALLQKLAICGECKNPLVPSFAYNRTKTKYSYYRCGSTLHGKHRRQRFNCSFKYVSFSQVHEQVYNALISLTEPKRMAQLDEKITAHNQTYTDRMSGISTQINIANDELKQVKAKKNEYVDVLITKQFSTQDRQRIHDRMNELDREEKKIQSSIATLQLEHAQCEDQLLSIDNLKPQLLYLRDTPDLEPDKYRHYLRDLLDSVAVRQDALEFKFKALPWTQTIPLNSS